MRFSLILVSLAPFILEACSRTQSEVATSQANPLAGHRILGVWTSVQDEDDIPPSDDEWEDILNEPEPAVFQAIFLQDGTVVFGGMLLGHSLAEERKWEFADEQDNHLVLRMKRNEREEADHYYFVNDDVFYMPHPGDPNRRMYMHRDDAIAPVPWLAKYVGMR